MYRLSCPAISMLAKYINPNYLPYIAFLTTTIAVGFLRGFIQNSPKDGFFGNPVWWQNYRIIHSISFIISAQEQHGPILINSIIIYYNILYYKFNSYWYFTHFSVHCKFFHIHGQAYLFLNLYLKLNILNLHPYFLIYLYYFLFQYSSFLE